MATVHIAGVLPRIGTTTLALQLVRFVQDCGYTACYVEMSRQEYIWGVTNIYEGVTKERQTGKTAYAGISMYSSDRLRALLDGKLGDYDYIIADFGSIKDPSYDISVFGGGDCGILVCGNKPNEIFASEDALAESMYADCITVFNFTDPADRPAIREMMAGRGDTTEFLPYIPDPFHAGKELEIQDFFQRLMDTVVRNLEA